jgi:quercetin dioxygenase-like cupin family protein
MKSFLKSAAKAVAILSVGVMVGAAGAKAMKEPKFTDFNDLKWGPMDPKDPTHSPQVSVVYGSLAKGPMGFFLKAPAGQQFPRHSHTNDYYAVVVQGTWMHSFADANDMKKGGPGSTWYQPGKQVHGDGCAPGADCVVFISMPSGKEDFIPAKEEAKTGDKKAGDQKTEEPKK